MEIDNKKTHYVYNNALFAISITFHVASLHKLVDFHFF